MAGADPVAVQRLMRHKNLRMTVDTYGHLAPGYLRGQVDRLSFFGELRATGYFRGPHRPHWGVAINRATGGA